MSHMELLKLFNVLITIGIFLFFIFFYIDKYVTIIYIFRNLLKVF